MDIRKSIDITFWNDEGHSAFGLKRHQSKALGLTLIITGILLANPPFIPIPDDIFNIILAKFLINIFHLSQSTALLLTYTIIAWGLFLLGIYIYPYNTKSLFNGYMNKLKIFVKRQLKNPFTLLIWIILGYIMFNFYKGIL